MNWRRNKGLIIWAFLAAVGYGIIELMIMNSDRITRYNLCEDEKDVQAESWDGVVVSKFLDSENHNYKTLKIAQGLNRQVKTQRIILSNDKSGLFEMAREGDVIAKNLGSLEAKLLHNNEESLFVIDFGCKE